MRTSSCSSCKADIVWAQTENGDLTPIDAAPAVNGNIELQLPNDPRDPPVAHVLRKGETRPPPLYLNHFVTCPHAEQHRKAKR